jgi:hypothetical protein
MEETMRFRKLELDERMRRRALFRGLSVGLFGVLAFSGCSPVMEATRPTPVDTSQFAVGENRVQIVEAIGAPTANVKDSDQSCDVYKLYTRGPGGVGKGVIAAGEGAADVVTLGLAEVIFTPLEAGTRNPKHTVTFCYDKDGKLRSLADAGRIVAVVLVFDSGVC